MIRWKWLVAVSVCGLAFAGGPAHGCQYNVREVGFIDVGIEPYRLTVYLPSGVSADELSGLKETMETALAETNIRFESIAADADANHPAMEIARTHGISDRPAVVLVSPDGQSMPLSMSRTSGPRSASGIPSTKPSLGETVSAALRGALDSPIQRQILDKCAESYGVVLLIEGPEPQANAAAREAISAACNQIGEQLEFLPKPIKKPPEMVVLDRDSLVREQVLLWTFRLKPEDVNQPHAAVFYGRGRWLGPLLEGQTLTAGNLGQLLSIVGADCECGLDYHWVLGTMLPVRWDETLQQRVAASLGFDPENPMVKMEMVSIVRRGLGGSDYPDVPLAYREIEIGEEESGPGAEDEGQGTGAPISDFGLQPRIEIQDDNMADSSPRDLANPQSSIRKPQSPIRSPGPAPGDPSPGVVGQVFVGSLAGMVVLVGLASLVVVLRARKP